MTDAQSTQEATSAVTASAGSPTKHIIYSFSHDNTCDLHLADLDGQNASCIVKNLVSDLVSSGKKADKITADQEVNTTVNTLAKFSPDGSKILFLMTVAFAGDTIDNTHGTTSRLYTLDTAGGSPKLITEDTTTGFPFAAAASPDGTLLAYTKPAGSYQKNLIVVSALDGSSPRQVSPNADSYQEIVWSPNGKQILATTNNQALVFDATATKGKSQKLNLPANLYYAYASWSPDGQEILIDGDNATGISAPVHTLYRYILSTKKAVKVGPDKTNIDLGQWSPDQQKLLVSVEESANHGALSLFSINPDGSGLQKLVDGVGAFDIAPDKTHIVYIGGSTGYLANLDGSHIQTLAMPVSTIAVQP